MNVKVNKLTNAHIYVNGNPTMGRADEVELPQIATKEADHKGLGMIGEIETPAGLQKMAMKIKWNSIYPEIKKETANPYKSVRFAIYSNMEQYENNEKVADIPVAAFISGRVKVQSGLKFKAQDNAELEEEFTVTAYKLEIGGEEIHDVDVNANIWRVNGVDLLAQYRANLGLA